MQVWVGTSGYSYADWVGPFYPPTTRPQRMLHYYSRHFPLVELNFTFYRLPTAAMLARLAEPAPEGFQFVVKLPRSLSHEQNSTDLVPFREAADELRKRGRLLGLLCQLPQATHRGAKSKAWLEHLADAFAGYRLAVEFRHHSWFDPEVPPWMRERDLDLVAVDVPDLPNLYPRGLVRSTARIYVRFHSRKPKKWYLSDKERYDYHYEDQALSEWIDAIRSGGQESDKILLLFNNCRRGQAAVNAQRMRQLLAQRAPELEIVPPYLPFEPKSSQRLLFD